MTYGAIAMGVGGKVVKMLAPLGYPLQTVVAGELMASVQAAFCSDPRERNFVDCEAIIKGTKRREVWRTDPSRP